MRRRTALFALTLAALSFFAAAQSVQAAITYGRSAVGYNSRARYVFGYGQTWTDYELAFYYDPEVYTVLMRSETTLDSGSDVGYSNPYNGYQYAAEYYTYSPAYQEKTVYGTASHHKLRPYYTSSYGYWFDPFNFFGFTAVDYTDFWGLGGYSFNPYNYIPVPVVRPFNTVVSITTPPDCGPGGTGFTAGGVPCTEPTPAPTPTPPQSCYLTITLHSISAVPATGDINGQTKPAMLGAPVALEARLNGAQPSDGSWTWTAEGNPEHEDGTTENNIYVWRNEGTFNVSVTFTTNDGRCTARATLRVNVTVPSIISYTGDIIPERLTRDVNTPCSALSTKDKFTLGCSRSDNPSLTQPGIWFSATAVLPEGTISDPTASKIKFTQIVNLYRRRHTAAHGTECITFRNGEGDIDSPTAWRIDTVDPYQAPGELGAPGTIGVNSFTSSNGTSMIKVVDSPGHPLSDVQNLSAVLDDRFEMLVFYFVGDPKSPEEGTSKLIGKLEWTWGGHITYNASTDTYSITQVNPSSRRILGQSTRQTRAYTNVPYDLNDRVINPNPWKPCGGATPNPTPTPEPTPNPTPVPTPPSGCSGNGAAFVSQSVPTTMQAGAGHNVSVTMRNTCGTTWVSGRHRLGSQNPHDNLNWGLGRVDLPAGVSVAPGDAHTFNFTVTAPSTPGLYNFQWRMVEESVEWFGELTPNVLIDVVGSGCDPWAEQDCYWNGGNWDPSTCQCRMPPPCRKCDPELFD